MHRYLRCFRDFAVENVAPAVVLPEHACPPDDNVHVTSACMSAP